MADLENILTSLPRFREAADALREMLLANLTMIGEIPAPTFSELDRAVFIAERYGQCGLSGCSVDAKGNAIGMIPGTDGRQNILLSAHSDTFVEDQQDQTIEIHADRVVGPFVGDNAIALAALATLPTLLEKLEIRPRANVYLIAAARTLGRGNLEGIRHIFQTSGIPFASGLCLEGLQLGRLNYASIGMLRGEITCRLPDNYEWAKFGGTGSIIPISDIIIRIGQIPRPQRPLTTVIIGSVHGGISSSNIARTTTLQFEVRSESSEIIRQIAEQIEDITEDVAGKSGTRVELDILAQREPGGIDIAHPLTKSARAILTKLGLQPSLYATTSMMAALRDAGIAALTLGITTGERKNELDEIDEAVAIAPMSLGMAQLVGMLLAMDGGAT